MEDPQWRGIFPIDQLPGKERVLGFRLANESGILSAIVLFPLGKLLLTLSVTHSPINLAGGPSGFGSRKGFKGVEFRVPERGFSFSEGDRTGPLVFSPMGPAK